MNDRILDKSRLLCDDLWLHDKSYRLARVIHFPNPITSQAQGSIRLQAAEMFLIEDVSSLLYLQVRMLTKFV